MIDAEIRRGGPKIGFETLAFLSVNDEW